MSSLAAARADNFYHPPDWDPRKKSRAEHAAGVTSKQDKWKAHPLRERAKKLHTEGVLTIRFEMPFNVRCVGCDNHIAKGVRFNAEKKQIGNYFSTKIWSFRFPCHCEDGTSRTDRRLNPHFIEVHTDPKNAEYVVAEGAVRVADPSLLSPEDLGVERALDPDEVTKRSVNPFYKLEMAGPAPKRKPWLTQLQDMRDDAWHDDYAANRALRKRHREEAKEALVEDAKREARGVRVALLPEVEDDVAAAQRVRFQAPQRRSDAARSEPRHRLLSGSIFGPASTTQRGQQRRGQQRQERDLSGAALAGAAASQGEDGASRHASRLAVRPRSDGGVAVTAAATGEGSMASTELTGAFALRRQRGMQITASAHEATAALSMLHGPQLPTAAAGDAAASSHRDVRADRNGQQHRQQRAASDAQNRIAIRVADQEAEEGSRAATAGKRALPTPTQRGAESESQQRGVAALVAYSDSGSDC